MLNEAVTDVDIGPVKAIFLAVGNCILLVPRVVQSGIKISHGDCQEADILQCFKSVRSSHTRREDESVI